MVKNGYYGNEGFGLAWDRIEVRYIGRFITTEILLDTLKDKSKFRGYKIHLRDL